MAGFQKFGKLSTNGWDAKTQTQTITLGQNAQIGLWGGGPNGEDLDVVSVDQGTCVVHEQSRPGVPHMRQFVMTALRVGETKVNAFLPGTSARYSEPITVKVVGQSAKKLVFFPGERMQGVTTLGKIYAVGSGANMEAAGGPPAGGKHGAHTFEPTPPGKYVLGPKITVVAPTWPKSVIPWGAELRMNPANEVEFESSPGSDKWVVATGKNGAVTKAQMAELARAGKKFPLATISELVREWFCDPNDRNFLSSSVWLKNEFGRMGWNLRSNGKPTPYFVHTTPADELAPYSVKGIYLTNSHGCIHLHPFQRDQFIKAGYLVAGVPLEVRSYTETGPPL